MIADNNRLLNPGRAWAGTNIERARYGRIEFVQGPETITK